ncbi:MAG: hypothetical protein AAGH41_13125 [Pseudomonadota bacterium]
MTNLVAAALALSFLQPDGTCPSASDAQAAFVSGSASEWPNYTEGPGARVQRQYPDTVLTAQAKFVPLDENGAAVCQYSNHVGWVITTALLGATKGDTIRTSYWRSEFTGSDPSQDQPGRETVDVCMKKQRRQAVPSVGCAFKTE